jgi:hypothetical protein
MNVKAGEDESKHFSVEDVVSYLNVEITHANDNRVPTKVIVAKIAVWLVVAAFFGMLFLIK